MGIDKNSEWSGVERILCVIYRVAASLLFFKAVIHAANGAVVDFLSFLALAFFFAGASFDSVNMFRIFVLGRVDFLGERKKLAASSKYLFVVSAVIAFLAWSFWCIFYR